MILDQSLYMSSNDCTENPTLVLFCFFTINYSSNSYVRLWDIIIPGT